MNEGWTDRISKRNSALFRCFKRGKFFFGHETEWETIDFGTLFDLGVEIFYCCCNGTLGKSYPE